jgi:hypothetical protein
MGFFILALPDLSTFFAALLFVIAANLAYDLLKRNAKSLRFPPGPRPKFLIGNALDFPRGDAGRVFAEWGKKYNSTYVLALTWCLVTDVYLWQAK